MLGLVMRQSRGRVATCHAKLRPMLAWAAAHATAHVAHATHVAMQRRRCRGPRFQRCRASAWPFAAPLALLRPLLGADLFFEHGGSAGPVNAAR